MPENAPEEKGLKTGTHDDPEIQSLNDLIGIWEASLGAAEGGAILGPRTDKEKEDLREKIAKAKERLKELEERSKKEKRS